MREGGRRAGRHRPPRKHPRLTLLVDHADITAEVLAPMLESNTVNVRAYRKLRWGNKTGLLLEAA